ncbi:TonB-dependent receptor [Niabella insulamsoli]|uniref:SusC/RagA family TonB-linked outer membrane protein n=1 Tax=Niabella insulamsoli TaxID=3144874 RepID=UPI0031FDC132
MHRINLLLICLLVSEILFGQQREVSGIVKDKTGPLSNVSVTIKESSGGTTTNEEGEFSIRTDINHTLVFTLVGYLTFEMTPGQDSTLEITLQSNAQGMDEVVIVGYGTKKRVTNTGATSAISAEAIRTVPTANVQNALTGRLPGFFSQQRSGQPGRDASDFFIRGISSLNPDGNKPLIIVDDIEYTYEQLSQINVNEIENITILKDASTTAVYGIKGANGVLIVTTRRGASGRPRINARIEGGLQSPVRKLEFLNAYNSALLENEAYTNDGLNPPFTSEDLEHFRTGDDPYGHPDVNWYNAIFKPFSLQTNSNVDVSGGNDIIKYFVSGGALVQNGALKDFSDPRNEVNNNYYFRRYNFRSNLDIKASKSLSVRLDVTTRFGDVNQPHAQNIVSEIYNFQRIRPYSAPFLNPNGSYAYDRYNPGNLATLNARLANSGYQRDKRSDFNVLFGVVEKLDMITKGLSFNGRIAYASTELASRQLFRGGLFEGYSPPSYYYNPEDDSYTLDPRGQYQLSGYTLVGVTDAYNKNVNLQGFLNYDRTFKAHHFTSLLLFNRQSFTDQKNAAVPNKFQGYSFKIGYDYLQKYLMDFNLGYNGSDRFKSGERYGLFPALGLGWNISNENFFHVNAINLLKLRGSYGVVGSDVVFGNRYLYNQQYVKGGGYPFGESSVILYPSLYEGDLGNNNVTWEKAKKLDIGIDLNMLNDKISMTIDYFRDIRYDQLITRGSISQVLGVGTARFNMGEVLNSGFDGQISYRNNIRDFQYNITGVFSFAKNRILFQDEATPAFPWLLRTGHPINQPFGYTFLGFYESQSDIENSARPLIPVQPGDLKYKDLNGDNIIDENDMGPIGKPNLPNTTAGLTLGCNYKGFSLSVLFQGSFNYSFYVTGTGIEPLQSQFQPIHQMRWTADNPDGARFPRLTTNSNSINSPAAYPSTFWMIDARYVRLKTVDLGYQLPSRMLPFKINNARFYLSAYNLLTFNNYNLYQQDPEVTSNTAGDAYMNQRVVNLGLQVGF